MSTKVEDSLKDAQQLPKHHSVGEAENHLLQEVSMH